CAVGQFEHMVWCTQSRHETWRLFEQHTETLVFLIAIGFSKDLLGGFHTDATHASHCSAFITHWRVRKGEKSFLVIAAPPHHERQVFVIGGLSRQGSRSYGLNLRPDFRPNLLKGLAQ